MKKLNAVIAAISNHRGKVMDDHRENGTIVLAGIAGLVKEDGTVIPVALCRSAYFSLNRLYVGDDGMAHVSRESVAGVVFPSRHGNDMEKAIAAYNEEQEDNKFSCGYLDHIWMFTYTRTPESHPKKGPEPIYTSGRKAPESVSYTDSKGTVHTTTRENLLSSKHFTAQ